MGVREIDRSLEQWQMGVKDLRRRVILARDTRERERWYAILLLAQGLTAAATAEALERDPHTIGRCASAFGEGGPAALIFEQTGGSPPPLTRRSRRSCPGRSSNRCHSGHRNGQLVLEGGASVCFRTVWHQPEPQQLPELASPAGVCLQASQEARWRLLKADESKRETFTSGVRRPVGGGPTDWLPRYSLPTTSHVPWRTRNCGVARWVLTRVSLRLSATRAARRFRRRRPATIRRCATRRARCHAWNWRATATGLGCLPDATEGKASRAAGVQLGQCAGPSWGGGAGVPQDA